MVRTSSPAPTVKSRALSALRLVPAAFLLAGVLTSAPSVGATGCHVPPSRVQIDGGLSRNETNVDLSADGGTAVANAEGGDDNLAIGFFGRAAAGNGGTANARANGGTIKVGDINSGRNTGNVIRVESIKPVCGTSSRILVNGGTARNETNVNLSADGGTAVANAAGGDDNVAVGIFGQATAGNGGTANAQANGGSIAVGDINSGGNVGNVIDVAPVSGGEVVVDGGTSSNETNLNASADGGTAVSNAAGGDDNVAVGVLGDAAAGNGGTATSQANGGTIEVGNINSGGNTGNVISVGP